MKKRGHKNSFYKCKGLVTNYGEGGGATKWEGGAREVLPLRKGGGGVLAILFWGSFYVIALSFSHIVRGGAEVSTL